MRRKGAGKWYAYQLFTPTEILGVTRKAEFRDVQRLEAPVLAQPTSLPGPVRRRPLTTPIRHERRQSVQSSRTHVLNDAQSVRIALELPDPFPSSEALPTHRSISRDSAHEGFVFENLLECHPAGNVVPDLPELVR